jgi:hypothetical protein
MVYGFKLKGFLPTKSFLIWYIYWRTLLKDWAWIINKGHLLLKTDAPENPLGFNIKVMPNNFWVGLVEI